MQQAAERIIAEFDKDHNGSLSQDELAAVPAVNVNRKWYDADKNGQISWNKPEGGLNQAQQHMNFMKAAAGTQ